MQDWHHGRSPNRPPPRKNASQVWRKWLKTPRTTRPWCFSKEKQFLPSTVKGNQIYFPWKTIFLKYILPNQRSNGFPVFPLLQPTRLLLLSATHLHGHVLPSTLLPSPGLRHAFWLRHRGSPSHPRLRQCRYIIQGSIV